MNDKGKEGLVSPKLLNSKRFRYEQTKVFLITVLLYCTWHASRTAWAYSKKGVKGSNSYFTDTKLGILDMSFMLAYAFGQFYNGWLGDQSELKIFLAIGTVISIMGYFLFALLARIEAYNILIFSICFLAYGFGQSRGFPGSTAILGNWIEASRRGMLLGVWNATSDNVGNIMGQQISRIVIEVFGFHWSTALFLTGGTMIGLTIVLFLYLKVHPNQAGFGLGLSHHIEEMREVETKTNILTHQDVDSDYVAVDHQTGGLSQGISFTSALKTPGIIKYAMVYACIKGSIYGLLFWLPDYLHSVMGFGQDTAFIAATYEVGQFIGAVGLGYITDKLGKRSVGLVVSLYISALVFVVLAVFGSGASVSFFATILFFAGMFIGGPQVIVGSVVSSDLGEKNSMSADVRSISTLAGIVNGTGSIAAALIQVIIPLLKSVSFYVYFGLCLGAAILLTSTAIEDMKASKANQNSSLIIHEETELEMRRSSRGSLH